MITPSQALPPPAVAPLRRAIPYRWLAIGLTVGTFGMVLGLVVSRTTGFYEPWAAEVLWIGGSAVASIGMLLLAVHDREGLDINAAIDTAIVAVIGLTASWQLLANPRYQDTGAVFDGDELAALVALPLVMIMPLALASHALVSKRRRASLGRLLPLGAAAWVVHYLIVLGRGYAWVNENSASQVPWFVGTALMAAALWRAERLPAGHHEAIDDEPDDVARQRDWLLGADAGTDGPAFSTRHDETGTNADREQRAVVARAALSLAPLAIPSVIEGIRYAWRGVGTPLPALAATLIVAGLTVARLSRQLQAQRATRVELETSEQYFRALAASSSDALVIVDRAGRIVKGSPNLVALLGDNDGGLSRTGAFPGADLGLLVSATSTDVVDLIEQAVARPGQVVSAEIRMTHSNGHQLWLAARAVNLLDDRSVGGIVINLHDVTARKNTERELEHLAFHDVLTGLANRALFRDRLEHAIARAGRTLLAPAIIYFDLDGFKKVNDSLGHEAGDELLKCISRRLLAAVRGGDTVARLGGDEFAVLVEYSNHPAREAGTICDRILEGLTEPIPLIGQIVTASASLGIAVGEPGLTASALLRHADIAMYRAKAEGKGRWMVYEPEMSHDLVHRIRIESDLVNLLDRSELELVYQPVVRLDGGDLVGFEALLRWHHPDLGLLLPNEFLPVAEETGAIIEIGKWALHMACATTASWIQRLPLPPDFTVGVNLSARELAEADLVNTVEHALAVSGLPGDALIVEVSEAALGVDATGPAKLLPELRALGLHVALDDFGIGGSPLTHLQRLPIDFLKIDRSFIHTVDDEQTIPPMVQGLIELGRTLSLTLLAEGIEHDMQRSVLARAGCTLGQGHLFSTPVPAREAEALLVQAATRAEAAEAAPSAP